jgi:hypothetical protein
MDEFDEFEETVSSCTPRETGPVADTYQNTVGLACPSCDEPFDDLVVVKEFTRLNLSELMDVCATVHDGNPVLFTHRK